MDDAESAPYSLSDSSLDEVWGPLETIVTGRRQVRFGYKKKETHRSRAFTGLHAIVIALARIRY